MAGTVTGTKRKSSGSQENEKPKQQMVVYDLVHEPEKSLLQDGQHIPVNIDGLTMIDNKHICVCVTVAKILEDGGQQLTRRELLKTDYFKKRWPQMLIAFYEAQAMVNDQKLPLD